MTPSDLILRYQTSETGAKFVSNSLVQILSCHVLKSRHGPEFVTQSIKNPGAVEEPGPADRSAVSLMAFDRRAQTYIPPHGR